VKGVHKDIHATFKQSVKSCSSGMISDSRARWPAFAAFVHVDESFEKQAKVKLAVETRLAAPSHMSSNRACDPLNACFERSQRISNGWTRQASFALPMGH
jgi:hypothetical protein